MAKPPVVERKQFEHMLLAVGGSADGKVKSYSRTPERDVALLLTLYGCALGTTEIATLTLRHYLTAKGQIKVNSVVPAEISLNGKERPLKWTNERVCAAIDRYLAWRLTRGHGVTVLKGAYRGLDPDAPLFLNSFGEPYGITATKLPSGKVSYTCISMAQLISKLHKDCGITGGSAQSARRTFAVMAARQPANVFRLKELAEVLGIGISSAKSMAGLDPKTMAAVVAQAARGCK